MTLDEQWKHAKTQVGEGWHELLDDLRIKLDKISSELKSDYEIFQIKEKFGGLRIGITNSTEQHLEVIRYFEDLSYHICEVCGYYGKTRNDLGWVLTLCEEHYIAKRKEIKEENLKYLKEKNENL